MMFFWFQEFTDPTNTLCVGTGIEADLSTCTNITFTGPLTSLVMAGVTADAVFNYGKIRRGYALSLTVVAIVIRPAYVNTIA